MSNKTSKRQLEIFQWAAGGLATILICVALISFLAGVIMTDNKAELRQARALALEPVWRAVVATGWIIALATVAALAGCLVIGIWKRATGKIVYPNAAGLYPVVDGRVINEPGAQITAAQRVPERLTDNRKITITGGAPGGQLPVAGDLAQPGQVALPERIPLTRLLPDVITLDALTLGAALSQDGQITPVTTSLHSLMHTLTVGASGWGKSTWLRSFLFQLAITSDRVGVVAIDTAGSEFNPLRDWSKLVYPVARDTQEAIAVLGEVQNEIHRRKSLYEQYPLATRLDEYNAIASEQLAPWVVVCDEGTNLLNQEGIAEPLRATVQTARQYGVYVLLAGQSAKASIVDTQTRDNFSSRLCFRTSPTSSRVVLDDKRASDLSQPGRGLLLLPGRQMTEVQAGYISREQFFDVLTTGQPSREIPQPAVIAQPPQGVDTENFQIVPTEEQLIQQLAEQGVSRRQIQMEIFGYTGGSAHSKVMSVLGAV